MTDDFKSYNEYFKMSSSQQIVDTVHEVILLQAEFGKLFSRDLKCQVCLVPSPFPLLTCTGINIDFVTSLLSPRANYL